MTARAPTIAAVAASLFLAAFSNTTDATSDLNAAASAACASTNNRTVRLPAGTLIFNTRPAPFPCALRLVGEGIGGTLLVRNFSGGAFLHWQRGADHSGGALKDVSIAAGANTHGGIAVYIQAVADTDASVNSYNRHSFLIDNVQVGRTVQNASWDFGLYLDGAANPDGNPNSVPGIRGVYVDKSTFGGTRTATVYLNKARGTELRLECYTPLNGSFAGVVMDNGTDSVLLQSRNCAFASWDGTGKGMMQNGTRVGPQ